MTVVKTVMYVCMYVRNMRWRAPDQEVDRGGHGKRFCKKICKARNLNKEDAMDRGRWKKLIKIG